jgi:hypothetical protein
MSSLTPLERHSFSTASTVLSGSCGDNNRKGECMRESAGHAGHGGHQPRSTGTFIGPLHLLLHGGVARLYWCNLQPSCMGSHVGVLPNDVLP